MKLTKLIPHNHTAFCEDERSCPAVYDTDTDDVVLQLYLVVDNPGIDLSAGEILGRMPKATLRALAAQLAEL